MGPFQLLLHAFAISPQESKPEQLRMNARRIQLACERLVEHCFAFIETIQRDICACQIDISECAIGVDPHRFLGFRDRLIEFPDVLIQQSGIVVAAVVPRVFLGDDLKLLRRFLIIARQPIVMTGDVELLRFACPFAMLESLLDVIHGKFILAQVAVNRCQSRVGHGEIRIQFDRTFEEGN